MIHVRVSHKNVGDLEQVSWRKGVEIAKIKEHRPPLILKGDEKARVMKGRIHEPRGERWPGHAVSTLFCDTLDC